MSRRFLFFRAGLILSVLAWMTACRLAAQINPHPVGTEAGQELAASLRAMRPDHEVKLAGTLQMFGRGHKIAPVPIFFESKLTDTNWSFTYETRATDTIGAEKLTIIFSTNSPNQYIYSRAPSPDAPLGEAKTLTGAEADIPLAGSDFLLSELGFEFYHWPEQERLPGTQMRGQACYVVASRNPHPSPGGYARVMTWVDEHNNQPLLAEAYAADKTKVKRFEVGSVGSVNGHWEVKGLKMFNEKTGSRTVLEFDTKEK
jgi:Outer membrane lipoprotein-sorting protein